ncbi:hypothetical protein D3C79_621210 [compost metagenome]
MGKVQLPENGGIVNIIAGVFQDTKGPAETYTAVNLFDIKLEKGHQTAFSVPQHHNSAVLVVNGEAVINGQLAKEHSFVLFENDGEEVVIKANEQAVLLFMSGEPIDEPIVSYGPFVMNTQEEIYQAFEDFQAGKFGTLE